MLRFPKFISGKILPTRRADSIILSRFYAVRAAASMPFTWCKLGEMAIEFVLMENGNTPIGRARRLTALGVIHKALGQCLSIPGKILMA